VTDSGDPRDAIHAAIQEHAPRGEDAVLTGWALVAEWMDHEGERWLTKAHAAATAQWAARGMHHEAIYGGWPERGESS
jgi:hypothetical protein